MKGIPFEQILEEMPPDVQARIKEGSRVLQNEYRLAQIREKAMKKQSEIDGMTQDAVSRLERRQDWLVSSLNTYVRGMGGVLKIVADLPGVGSVELPLNAKGKMIDLVRSNRKAPKTASATKGG